jgi:four helix bundle protein
MRSSRSPQYNMKNSYRDLIVWQRSMDLADEVYATVQRFPKHELFGLSSQLRRAAVSIAALIAEGHGRYSLIDFRHYLRQARGSTQEVETELLIAARQNYISSEHADSLVARTGQVSRLLNGLIRSIERRMADR